MLRPRFCASLLALALALGGTHGACAAGAAAGLEDGWHSWDVPAGSSGRRACCYQSRNGHAGVAGCRLGGDAGGLALDEDCEPADGLRVYVRVADGQVDEIHAFSAGCPVATASPIVSAETRSTAESIAWLERFADGDSNLARDAVAAIAMHADGAAFTALRALIEDRSRGLEIREQALFWLAQSDDDAAFDYLDRILTRR